MTKNSIINYGVRGLLATGLAATLVACGGGGSSSDDSSSTEILTQGSVQRFGSVYVNDTRYVRSSNGRVITDDNPSAGEDSLRIGMKVKLRGRYNDDGTGTYDSIEVDNELKGPIQDGSIDIPDLNTPKVGSFTVLGTTVVSKEGTYFDESGTGNTINSLADLEDGGALADVVEVSGLFNENGELEALRIEKKADDLGSFLTDMRKLEVKGTIASVNVGAQQFTYESLQVVDYTNAEIDNDLPANPASWVGLYVESKSDPDEPNFVGYFEGGNTGSILQATKVDNEAPDIGDGFEAELEGMISDFNGLDDFKVSMIPVDAADAIIFCPNVTLGNGVKVKVRGSAIDKGGVATVDAASVECRQAKTVRLEGTVQSNVNGTITLLDVPVLTNDKTEKDDLSSIGDLVQDDAIEIRGFVDGNGDVIAVRVELEDSIDPDDFIVQAPKDQLANVNEGGDSFTLLGITIDTSGLDGDNNLIDNDFEGLNDQNITRAAFYQALRDGTAPGVKAKGTYNPGNMTLTADEVELQQDDD
ncbi:MAG: DUF5666 domain-containing protein [Gammaproteobacteria bacterium]|nr:DUF5666 domain-containing protein [Gammaproteobacteria bacterium]